MKARDRPGPANTTSRGSSPTQSVRVTRGGTAEMSTTLTEAGRWVTTHTSSGERTAPGRDRCRGHEARGGPGGALGPRGGRFPREGARPVGGERERPDDVAL